MSSLTAICISKEKLWIIGFIDDKDPAASTLTQGDLYKRPDIGIVLFDAIYIKLSASPTIGVLKAGGIQSRNPEDRAVWVYITNPIYRL
ncbi:hypothetical protein FOMG_17037 [Fusarium oxysporum f. sp. melonis 26406]|uniref:Uncharacterized protein n=1 Tax=Fusarium oxysporum f. sp. melonis 26406 TaxID=1089452 RepID=W9ZCP1_FUSOX|nr:hypothetical protein FOMG_17037 [Fusarium oxysporum f. sp. melonis 26406]